MDLQHNKNLFVKQIREMAELFGVETRNKYGIFDEQQQPVGFAAEQQKGWLGFLLRQFLGHWRTFDIQFLDAQHTPFMKAVHPFRFFMQRLEVVGVHQEKLGALQQRFAIFRKRFDVENEHGQVMMQVASPFWKAWTFPFFKGGRHVATISKKWTGLLTEMFTDKDTFQISFEDGDLTERERKVLLAASIFIDLQYFERKAGN